MKNTIKLLVEDKQHKCVFTGKDVNIHIQRHPDTSAIVTQVCDNQCELCTSNCQFYIEK